MATRPSLAIPCPSAEEYLVYWGDVQYADFCRAFGLTRLSHVQFVDRTLLKGPHWWERDFQLKDIKLLPSPDTYRALLSSTHPNECAGPRRFEHYIQMHRGDRTSLLELLDPDNDIVWREWAARI